jgi:hypothetical protein
VCSPTLFNPRAVRDRARRVPWWAVVATAAGLAFLAVVPFDWLPWLRGPAPYPPEWQWEYRAIPPGGSVIPAAAAGLLLCLLIASSGTRRAARRPRLAAAGLLVCATGAGWGFSLACLEVESGQALRTLIARTVYRTGMSYFNAAEEEAADPLRFLRNHDELLPQMRKTAKHAATHPPGAVLLFRAAIATCHASPVLTRTLLEVAEATDTRPGRSNENRAAALLGALAIGLACAATCWPVALLARRLGASALDAARVGALWTLLPGPVLMAPQVDQALALPVACAVAVLSQALLTGSPGWSSAWGAAAGLLAGLAAFMSYGGPALVLVGGLGVLAARLAERGALPAAAARPVAVAVAVAIATFLAPAALGHDPLGSLRTALAIHREAYTLPRSYSLWLLHNPLDAAAFLGAPIAVLLALRMPLVALGAARTRARLFRVGVLLGTALLLVSGQTRGEVGRIWIPLMPFLLVAALVDERRADDASASPALPAAEALLLSLLLAGVCLQLRLYWRLP